MKKVVKTSWNCKDTIFPFRNTLIYTHMTSCTLPACDMRLGLLTVAMLEARNFVESPKPYINILLVRKLFLQLLVASFHYTPVYYCNFPSHTSWIIHLVWTTIKVTLF